MTDSIAKFPTTISSSGDRYIIIIPKKHEHLLEKYQGKDVMVEVSQL